MGYQNLKCAMVMGLRKPCILAFLTSLNDIKLSSLAYSLREALSALHLPSVHSWQALILVRWSSAQTLNGRFILCIIYGPWEQRAVAIRPVV